ncbi:MAG: DinB family protein [Bacteroidetes bacterium]|nr:DinB family protein [Bacteroidota bacterium]
MKNTTQLADRIREVLLSGKWIAQTNFKEQLSGVSLEDAHEKVGNLNTLAMLAFHTGYYINGIVKVLEGGPLDIRDKHSFDMPPLESQSDWENLLEGFWADAEKFADLVEQMPDEKLDAPFVDEKYGDYRRNIEAMIEHSYYHLGQVSLIKKMLTERTG